MGEGGKINGNVYNQASPVIFITRSRAEHVGCQCQAFCDGKSPVCVWEVQMNRVYICIPKQVLYDLTHSASNTPDLARICPCQDISPRDDQSQIPALKAAAVVCMPETVKQHTWIQKVNEPNVTLATPAKPQASTQVSTHGYNTATAQVCESSTLTNVARSDKCRSLSTHSNTC